MVRLDRVVMSAPTYVSTDAHSGGIWALFDRHLLLGLVFWPSAGTWTTMLGGATFSLVRLFPKHMSTLAPSKINNQSVQKAYSAW